MLEHAQWMKPEQAQLLHRVAFSLTFLLSGGYHVFPRSLLAVLTL